MTENVTTQSQFDDIYQYVSACVFRLQEMYLSETTRSIAASQLAVLRRAVTNHPGGDPYVWSIEYDGLPESLVGFGQNPSAGERAVHVALTLYAVHQQSQRQGMHCSGKEFDIGAAVRRHVYLSKGVGELQDGQLPRRFAAMVTADSLDELAHHIRQLVHMLKADALPIDYGRLARQLLAFQDSSRRDGVRLEWARAYSGTKYTTDQNHDLEI